MAEMVFIGTSGGNLATLVLEEAERLYAARGAERLKPSPSEWQQTYKLRCNATSIEWVKHQTDSIAPQPFNVAEDGNGFQTNLRYKD